MSESILFSNPPLAGRAFAAAPPERREALYDAAMKAIYLFDRAENQSAERFQRFAQWLVSDCQAADEYRSLMENAPVLMIAIAQGRDESPGALREKAITGQLAAAAVLTALWNQRRAIYLKFSSLRPLLERERAWTAAHSAGSDFTALLSKATKRLQRFFGYNGEQP